jgi:hypothetical protein
MILHGRRVPLLNCTPFSLNRATTWPKTRLSSQRWYVDNISEPPPSLTTSKFIKGAKDFRSYLIDNVRKRAVTIFSIKSVTDAGQYSVSASDNRSQVPAFTDLLKNPKKPDEQYAVFPRVLFTDYKVVQAELFGSSALLKVRWFDIVCLDLAHSPPDRS